MPSHQNWSWLSPSTALATSTQLQSTTSTANYTTWHTDLGAWNKEKASSKQQSLHCSLHVTELDSVQIENALTVRQNQCIQREYFKHLECRHQCTAALLDDVTHCNREQHNDLYQRQNSRLPNNFQRITITIINNELECTCPPSQTLT